MLLTETAPAWAPSRRSRAWSCVRRLAMSAIPPPRAETLRPLDLTLGSTGADAVADLAGAVEAGLSGVQPLLEGLDPGRLHVDRDGLHGGVAHAHGAAVHGGRICSVLPLVDPEGLDRPPEPTRGQEGQ